MRQAARKTAIYDPANPVVAAEVLAANFDPRRHVRFEDRPAVAPFDLASMIEGDHALSGPAAAKTVEAAVEAARAIVERPADVDDAKLAALETLPVVEGLPVGWGALVAARLRASPGLADHRAEAEIARQAAAQAATAPEEPATAVEKVDEPGPVDEKVDEEAPPEGGGRRRR